MENNTLNIYVKDTSPDEINYYVKGKLDKVIRNNIKLKIIQNTNTLNNKTRKSNSINKPRKLSMGQVYLESHPETLEVIDIFRKAGQNDNLKILRGKKIAYLFNLTNIWDKNLKNSLNEGTTLTNNTYNTYVTRKNILGKVNPLKYQYFLAKGVGKELLNGIIKHLREKGYQILILHAGSIGLEDFYRKFGFKIFPQEAFILYTDEYRMYYYNEDRDSGHLMYKIL